MNMPTPRQKRRPRKASSPTACLRVASVTGVLRMPSLWGFLGVGAQLPVATGSLLGATETRGVLPGPVTASV